MHVTSAVRTLLLAVALAVSAPSLVRVDAAANTAGAAEHLIAAGGECVRLFHSAGSIGCRTTTRSGDMAPLLPIESESELAAWLASDATAKKPMLVLPEHLLTAEFVTKTKDRLAGVFAYPTSDHNVSFVSTTPQGDGSPDAKLNPFASKKIAWNSDGLGLYDTQLDFPVVLLKDRALGDKFTDRAKMNTKQGSGATYRAWLKYYYGPQDMTSRQCLQFKNVYGQRAPKCDPIGGQSSWGVRGDRTANETIVVMASMDASGLSQVLVPGANEAASGVVALLAATKALQVIPDSEFNKQIVFALFQAEKFGFVGSRRFLMDLTKAAKDATSFCSTRAKNGNSPFGSEFCSSPVYPSLAFASINPSSISYAIAVDQVGRLGKAGNFSLHVNPNANTSSAATLVKTMSSVPSAKSKVGKASVSGALPPTSLTSFVNANEFGQKSLVGAVLAGYDATFEGSGVYGSRHDVVEGLDVDAVVAASQVLAESVYTLGVKNASAASLAKIQVDKALVTELLSCISANWTCAMMRDVSTPWVTSLIKYLPLGDGSWPTYKIPTSLYPGPLDFNRQPFVLKDANKDTAAYVTDFNGTWSDEGTLMYLFPNAYETFTRAFLASSLADAKATTDKTCAKSQDCEGTDMECVHPGVCASKRAHFHDAYSPAIKRTPMVQIYDITDETMPLWAEPQWDNDVGSYVFPDPGELIGWLALAIGVVVTGIGAVLSRVVLGSVQKMKLL